MGFFASEVERGACAAEFIGTFYLVLTIALTVLQSSALAPLAIGMMLAAMVFASAPSSGAHLNPAVTLGIWLTGRRLIPVRRMVLYVAAQCLGALAAGALSSHLLGSTVSLAPGDGYTTADAAMVEIVFSTALVFVVLNTATLARAFQPTHSADFAPLAIGFTVLAGAFAVGPVSGCALNPAAAVGLAVPHAMRVGWRKAGLGLLHIYVLCPFAGAAFAALAFVFVRPSEYVLRSYRHAVEKEDSEVDVRTFECEHGH
jgi:aquaporin Z